MSSAHYPRHIPSIPYSDPPSRLRTLDIWLPRPDEDTPSPPLPWLIYIHGGAWRDPTQNARSDIEPTIHHLVTSHPTTLAQLGGIASLNYRLSPYPSHSTDPSDPSDPDRNVAHPTHIRDIAQAIHYLEHTHHVTRWLGVGHSCGATMLLHLVSRTGLDLDSPLLPMPMPMPMPMPLPATGPEGLILLAGIYHLPLLLQNHAPPACAEQTARAYEAMVTGAFGADNRAAYLAASPVAGRLGSETWPEGRLVVMAHSREDELVERAQQDVMCVALDREGWSIVVEEGEDEDEEDELRAQGRRTRRTRVLNVRDLKGGHDFVWKDGRQIAALVAEVVQRLV